MFNLLVSAVPKPREIARTLSDLGAAPSDRAMLVCAGNCEVPVVVDSRFEPEVFRTNRRAASHLTTMIVWPAIFFFAAGLSTLFPSAPLHFLSGGLKIGWFGAIMWSMILGPPLIAWIRSLLYPDYVRLAPGIIQIIKYNWLRRRPLSIRSYPMTAGTTVIAHSLYNHPSSFLLARGELEDRFDSYDDSDDESGLLMRTWHAILSTAPTPSLSETQLIG